jgi:hypothetical protein
MCLLVCEKYIYIFLIIYVFHMIFVIDMKHISLYYISFYKDEVFRGSRRDGRAERESEFRIVFLQTKN